MGGRIQSVARSTPPNFTHDKLLPFFHTSACSACAKMIINEDMTYLTTLASFKFYDDVILYSSPINMVVDFCSHCGRREN